MTNTVRFTQLVRRIEQAYPELPPISIANGLRRLAGQDGPEWRAVLGVEGPAQDLRPRGPLSQQDINELRGMLAHGTNPNRDAQGRVVPERGIILDGSTGRAIAPSHVIAGIVGGVHRETRSGPQHVNNYLGVDPLYTMTIAGDLGQTTARLRTDASMYGGIGQDATAAELNADIDGFLLGQWLSETRQGFAIRQDMYRPGATTQLSDLLDSYYHQGARSPQDRTVQMTSSATGQPLQSISRLSNYRPTLTATEATLRQETERFTDLYMRTDPTTRQIRGDGGPRVIRITAREIAESAVNRFVNWVDRELNRSQTPTTTLADASEVTEDLAQEDLAQGDLAQAHPDSGRVPDVDQHLVGSAPTPTAAPASRDLAATYQTLAAYAREVVADPTLNGPKLDTLVAMKVLDQSGDAALAASVVQAGPQAQALANQSGQSAAVDYAQGRVEHAGHLLTISAAALASPAVPAEEMSLG